MPPNDTYGAITTATHKGDDIIGIKEAIANIAKYQLVNTMQNVSQHGAVNVNNQKPAGPAAKTPG